MGCHFLLQGSSPPRDQTWLSCIAGRFFLSLLCKTHFQMEKLRQSWDLNPSCWAPDFLSRVYPFGAAEMGTGGMDGILKNSQKSGRERSRVQNCPRGEGRASWGRGSVGVRAGTPLRKRWQGRRLQMHPHPCVRGRRQEVREVSGWGEICLALRLRRGQQPAFLAGQGRVAANGL